MHDWKLYVYLQKNENDSPGISDEKVARGFLVFRSLVPGHLSIVHH